MEKITKNLSTFLVPVAIVLAGIMVSGAIFASKKNNAETPTEPAETDNVESDTTPALTNGSFKYYEDATITLEDGKPVVAMFSTATCPHCTWSAETFDNVVKEYQDAGEIKGYHFNYTQSGIVDTISGEAFEAIPTQLDELNARYGEGYVPVFIIGGKYFRVGNAFESEDDLTQEAEELKRVIEQVLEEANK